MNDFPDMREIERELNITQFRKYKLLLKASQDVPQKVLLISPSHNIITLVSNTSVIDNSFPRVRENFPSRKWMVSNPGQRYDFIEIPGAGLECFMTIHWPQSRTNYLTTSSW